MPLPDREESISNIASWLFGLGFRGGNEGGLATQIVDFVYMNEPLTIPHELTAEQKADARAIFEGKNKDRSACYFCAGLHFQVAALAPTQQPCPRIKRIERHTDGLTVLSIEHWPPGEWEADVVFPSDVYDDDGENDVP